MKMCEICLLSVLRFHFASKFRDCIGANSDKKQKFINKNFSILHGISTITESPKYSYVP